MIRGLFATSSLCLVLACSSTGEPEKRTEVATPNPEKGAEKGGVDGPTCFFESGDIRKFVRIETKTGESGAVLEVAWDAAAPAGETWMPPKLREDVNMTFGVECAGPFDVWADSGVTAERIGDHAFRVKLPASLSKKVDASCSSRKLNIPVDLNTPTYPGPCKPRLVGDGLPFYYLRMGATVAADGSVTIDRVEAASYLEG